MHLLKDIKLICLSTSMLYTFFIQNVTASDLHDNAPMAGASNQQVTSLTPFSATTHLPISHKANNQLLTSTQATDPIQENSGINKYNLNAEIIIIKGHINNLKKINEDEKTCNETKIKNYKLIKNLKSFGGFLKEEIEPLDILKKMHALYICLNDKSDFFDLYICFSSIAQKIKNKHNNFKIDFFSTYYENFFKKVRQMYQTNSTMKGLILSFLDDPKEIGSIIEVTKNPFKNFGQIGVNLSLIENLNLNYNFKVGLELIEQIKNYSQKNNLKRLTGLPADISNRDLINLCKQFPDLTHLDLYSCRNITDAELIEIGKICTKLTSINLGGCYKITNAGLSNLAQNCKNLTHLNIKECYQITDDGVRDLAQNCRNLESINLQSCKEITDDGLIALAQNCRNLESINLQSCKEITDDGLIALAQNCANLKSIDLAGCDQITDDGLIALAQNCHNLTSINLYGCNKITDNGLGVLAQNCPNLTFISLGSSSFVDLGIGNKITDAGLKDLIQNCPNLTDIRLSSDHFTDAGLRFLAQNRPNLTYLDIYTCNKITYDGLVSLAHDYPNLSDPFKNVVKNMIKSIEYYNSRSPSDCSTFSINWY